MDEAPRQSREARAALPKLLAGLICSALGVLTACSTVNDREALLDKLKAGLVSARAMPPGSRPEPPELDLRSLEGASKSQLQRRLGDPTYCGEEGDGDCATSSRWQYRWGPPARPLHAGDGFVYVTTGGPSVIELQFTNGCVSSARWMGQR